MLLYGQFFTIWPFWLHLKHVIPLCFSRPSQWGWEPLVGLKLGKRAPRTLFAPRLPPRAWCLPRLKFLPLLTKSALSADFSFSFFSARFIYSSINNPLTFSQSRSSAFLAFKLVRKLSYDSGKLPKTTVANFFEEISSFISRNCSAREVMWVKCCIKSASSFMLAA